MKKFALYLLVGGAAALAPSAARACACGCGVFDVATSTMLPEGQGGMAYIQYDYQDQDQDWHATGPSSSGANGDKEIATAFFMFGGQYMFNRSWGAQLELPYDQRYFKTVGGPTGNDVESMNWSGLGDMRVEGIYTGFFPDMSAGITFGLKLPTGDHSHEDPWGDIDRDSELGTGSTDVLLGGFYRHQIGFAKDWTWFAQALLDVPTLIQDKYRPGSELDTAVGVYYKGWTIGDIHITPIAQVIPSIRTTDYGDYASGGINDPPVGERDSGYERILLSPGVEMDYKQWSLYADAELPVFQDFTGNQLVAPWLLKVGVIYHF